TYNSGTNVPVTQTAAAGSTFGGWSGACSGVNACNVLMDANKSVTATFTLNQTGDTVAPTIKILSPYVSKNPTTPHLSGSAADNVGVTSVTWIDNRGHSGTAKGTAFWSIDTPIQNGNTRYTVTAHDAAGNVTSASVTLRGN